MKKVKKSFSEELRRNFKVSFKVPSKFLRSSFEVPSKFLQSFFEVSPKNLMCSRQTAPSSARDRHEKTLCAHAALLIAAVCGAALNKQHGRRTEKGH
jgi:hypothetical protein